MSTPHVAGYIESLVNSVKHGSIDPSHATEMIKSACVATINADVRRHELLCAVLSGLTGNPVFVKLVPIKAGGHQIQSQNQALAVIAHAFVDAVLNTSAQLAAASVSPVAAAAAQAMPTSVNGADVDPDEGPTNG